MSKIVLPIAPVPKPRMTRSDKWKKRPCVLRYFDFKDTIQREYKELLSRVPWDTGEFSIVFNIQIKKSWSKKKKAALDGQPHKDRPDLDNYLKALLDSLFLEDKEVWRIAGISKLWTSQSSSIVFYF